MTKTPTPAQVEKLYIKLGSHRAVGEHIGRSRSWVQQTLVRLNEQRRRASEVAPPIPKPKRTAVTKEEIEEIYLGLLAKNRRRPSMSEMIQSGFSRDTIKARYGNMTALHAMMDATYAEEISEHVVTADALFTRAKMEKIEKLVGKKTRFFITTAVAGKEIHTGFMETVDLWCSANDGVLLILPCADVWDRQSSNIAASSLAFDPWFKDRLVISRKVALNDNLSLSDIRVSAKQIKPLTGLARIGQRNKSMIVAATKQFLEYTGMGNDRVFPHATLTTGTCTIANYRTDRYMSERLSNIAENDHVIGGVIVEIEDDKHFHFRHVQAADDGSFVDLGKRWFPDGTTATETATLVLGDWHADATDKSVRAGVADMLSKLDIGTVILHDFFDGCSINHHDAKDPGKLARKHDNGLSCLRREIEIGGCDLNWFHDRVENLVVVKSNHDEFLDRYLDSGRYLNDYQNSTISHDLALAKRHGDDVVKYAYETYGSLRHPEKIVWLRRDESYKIANVELGAHGDKGANGSRGTLDSIEKAYGNCVVGHTHSAAIYRGVFRVGTSTKFELDYNIGPSSWTHTCCLVYHDGSRQLVNFIGTRWRLQRKNRS